MIICHKKSWIKRWIYANDEALNKSKQEIYCLCLIALKPTEPHGVSVLNADISILGDEFTSFCASQKSKNKVKWEMKNVLCISRKLDLSNTANTPLVLLLTKWLISMKLMHQLYVIYTFT